MKKMLMVLTMFALLMSAHKGSFSLLNYFSGEYFAYTETPELEDCIFLGTCYLNNGQVSKNDNLVGESMVIKNFEPASAIKLLDAKVVKTEQLETGAVVIYAFSSKIKTNVKVDGERVNLQIAYYDDHSVIGWPVILGSF